MNRLKDFAKRSDFLVCIDSDGTAIDSMTSKHKRCFGPCFIEEWRLEKQFSEVLALWCQINLHGATRGKNKFITLYLVLEILNRNGRNEDLRELKKFVENAQNLSHDALKKRIVETEISF